MTFTLKAIGVDYRRLETDIKPLGFTAARCFQSEAADGVVGPEEFVALCRDAGLEAMGRLPGCTWWVTMPEEPKFGNKETTYRESVRLRKDVVETRSIVNPRAIPVCYVPGHYRPDLVDVVAVSGTEVMLGSYARMYGYPPQFTLWRPTCLTGELRCVALNCEHQNADFFRWDLFATLAAGAKSIAIYRPHALEYVPRSAKATRLLESWWEFKNFVNANDRLLRSGVRTVQSVGSEMYDEFQVKNDKGQVVCTVTPQPKDQLVTWSLGYERCSVRVNGDSIETKSWRGM